MLPAASVSPFPFCLPRFGPSLTREAGLYEGGGEIILEVGKRETGKQKQK